MFLPQLAEVDSFDTNGKQKDDINSLWEYIDQVMLGNFDETPEDEDDDNSRHLIITKTVDLFNTQDYSEFIKPPYFFCRKQYSILNTPYLISSIKDILSPPPEA